MDEEKISQFSALIIIITLLILSFLAGLLIGYNFFMQEKVKDEVYTWCADINNTNICCMTCDQINKAKCYNQITNQWTCTPNTLCPNCLDANTTTMTWTMQHKKTS